MNEFHGAWGKTDAVTPLAVLFLAVYEIRMAPYDDYGAIFVCNEKGRRKARTEDEDGILLPTLLKFVKLASLLTVFYADPAPSKREALRAKTRHKV